MASNRKALLFLFCLLSVVHFNPKTNIADVLDDAGNFITGWKLTPGTPQFQKFFNDGFPK